MSMISWLYCLFGKEHEMMPYFMRHYASQVDQLIMLDGGSDDKTRAIIAEYNHAVIEPSPFSQSVYDEDEFIKFIEVKYKEARGVADWVIVVDCDEFLYDQVNLRELLSVYFLNGIRAVTASGYQMAARAFPVSDGQMVDLVRVGRRDKQYDKTSIFDPALDVRWSVGRHTCSIDNYEPKQTGIKLLHYRYFGEDYLRQRNARNYARRSENDKVLGRGWHGAPDLTMGKFSPEYYDEIIARGRDVIGAVNG